jgi:diguanylate cyclase (GGDEF)-like protein
LETQTPASILELCIELDSLTTQIYHHFSLNAENPLLCERWRILERDENTHIRFWRILLDAHLAGSVPLVFEDPAGLYRDLDHARLRLHEIVQRNGTIQDTERMLLAACHMEVYFLNHSLLQLLRHVSAVAADVDAFDEYHGHLERFLATVREFGSSAELALIGETIARLWIDNRRLLDFSLQDPLTGLLNRRGFFKTAVPLSGLAGRRGSTVAVIMLDIDHFKRVNDSHGHQAGDDVLRLVAQTARTSFRGSDVPARYGGEEFVIFLPEVKRESVQALGEKLRTAVAEASPAVIPVTVSIGIADAVPARDVPTEAWLAALIERADTALYGAKQSGRNRVVVSPAR